MSKMVDEKKRLRRELKARLAGWSAADAARAGLCIAAQIEAWPALREVPQIVAFASLPGEVETRPLFDIARRLGTPFLLPRMRGVDLEFVPVEDFDDLLPGRHGVRESAPSRAAVAVVPGALVLVPGLAFDREGGRLGRGAGYYDREIGRLRAESGETVFLGLGASMQIVPRVPMAPGDVFLDGVLTEVEWIWAARPRGPQENGIR